MFYLCNPTFHKTKLINQDSIYTLIKIIDAKNQFNTFIEQAQKNKQDLKSIHKIIALMDYINPYSKLPKEKFRHIEDNNPKTRNDIYEFKDKSIRIYVIFQPPSFYIIKYSLFTIQY